MAAHVQRKMALLVISLFVAVISLPMAAADVLALQATPLQPITQGVRTPIRIAMNSDGSGGFFVTDPRSGGVLKFNAAGEFLQKIGTAGVPQGIAVKSNGDLVVSQGSFAAIIDAVSGVEKKRLGLSGVATQFQFADGVAVDNDNNIYVVDSKGCNVKKYDASGEYLLQFGSAGTSSTQFSYPSGIAYEKNSQLLAVVDTLNKKIKFYSKAGVYQSVIGISQIGSLGALEFQSPQGVTFEYSTSTPRMYVADAYNSTVQVIDVVGAGSFVTFIGDYGASNGQLMIPSDVAFDQVNKRLIVANGYGNVTLYGIDGGVTPTSSVIAAPVLTVNPPLSIVNTASVALDGTVTSGSNVSCVLNGAQAFSASVVGTSWSCTVTGLQSGANAIEVVARNASPVAVSKQYSISYLAGGPSLRVNPLPDYASASPLTIDGTVDPGATVQVCNATTSVCGSAVVTNGSWSYGQLALVSGVNNIQVSAVLGGTSMKAVSTKFDNVAPVVVLSTVTNAATVNNQVVNVTGTVQDSYLKDVQVNGQAVSVNNGVFSAAVSGVTELHVVATDLANNVTTIDRTGIIYDSSKTKLSVTSHADGAVVAASSQMVSGTADKGATVTVGSTSVPVSGGVWSSNVTLSAGMNDIQIVAADGCRTKLTLFLDAAKPALSVSTPKVDVATNQSVYQVAGKVDATASLSYNGTTQASEVPFALSFSQEGPYSVLLAADDGNGNVSYSVRNILYDVTPPALTVSSATAQTTTLSGTAEPGASVVVRALDTGAIVGTVTAVNNNWTANLGSSRDPLNLIISATDAAGNIMKKTSFAPDGNINYPADLLVTFEDARYCNDKVVGVGAAPTDLEIAHGDIGPLLNGLPSPNGKIDMSDCVLILRKAAGLTVPF